MSPDIEGHIDNGDAIVIDFESAEDKDYLIAAIKGYCSIQQLRCKVTIYDGTLKSAYSYEHDGT